MDTALQVQAEKYSFRGLDDYRRRTTKAIGYEAVVVQPVGGGNSRPPLRLKMIENLKDQCAGQPSFPAVPHLFRSAIARSIAVIGLASLLYCCCGCGEFYREKITAGYRYSNEAIGFLGQPGTTREDVIASLGQR